MTSRLAAADLQKAADTLVIALACAGDDSAFAEVLRRRQARVRKFMYHLCRQTALGDDLAQQVFLKAWRSLGQLRSAAAFDGWLKKIMVTVWLQEVRRSRLATVSDVDLADLAVQHDSTAARMDLDAALQRCHRTCVCAWCWRTARAWRIQRLLRSAACPWAR